MKKGLLPIILPVAIATLMMTNCRQQSQEPAQPTDSTTVATTEAPAEVTSTIDFNAMEATAMPHFKDGDGEVFMKMFQDGETKVMLCTVPAGASVGYHTHDTSMEVILVQKGTATILFDGVEQTYTEGQAHYCPKGHGHSISNKGSEDLVIYNVVAAQ